MISAYNQNLLQMFSASVHSSLMNSISVFKNVRSAREGTLEGPISKLPINLAIPALESALQYGGPSEYALTKRDVAALRSKSQAQPIQPASSNGGWSNPFSVMNLLREQQQQALIASMHLPPPKQTRADAVNAYEASKSSVEASNAYRAKAAAVTDTNFEWLPIVADGAVVPADFNRQTVYISRDMQKASQGWLPEGAEIKSDEPARVLGKETFLTGRIPSIFEASYEELQTKQINARAKELLREMGGIDWLRQGNQNYYETYMPEMRFLADVLHEEYPDSASVGWAVTTAMTDDRSAADAARYDGTGYAQDLSGVELPDSGYTTSMALDKQKFFSDSRTTQEYNEKPKDFWEVGYIMDNLYKIVQQYNSGINLIRNENKELKNSVELKYANYYSTFLLHDKLRSRLGSIGRNNPVLFSEPIISENEDGTLNLNSTTLKDAITGLEIIKYDGKKATYLIPPESILHDIRWLKEMPVSEWNYDLS